MSTPLFLPVPRFVPAVRGGTAYSVADLCAMAGVACRASGAWTRRRVHLVEGKPLSVVVQAGFPGDVLIRLPKGPAQDRARLALGVMAYSVFDLVAKQSIAGQPWSRVAPPMGRPRMGQALSSAERQRRHRARRA